MAKQKDGVRKFGFRDKLAYAMGDFGCNMSFALNGTITTFYTMYVGLSTEIMALLIILLKVWDGINDPIMGAILDKFKPKKGGSKFKPFIFWGAIALVVSGALVFLPIKEIKQDWIKVIICIFGYLVWDTAYTVVNVPYGSMANVITDVPEERASLSMWRSIGAMIANLPVMVLLPMIMYQDYVVNGQTIINEATGKPFEVLVGERVFFVALIMGVLGLLSFIILIKGTTERVKPLENQEPEAQMNKEKVNYFKVLKSFAKNKAAIGMTVASIFQLIMMNGLAVATNALYKDFFGMGSESGIFMLVSYLPLVAIMPAIVPLVKKFGKKEATQWPLLLGVLGGSLMMILPENIFRSGGEVKTSGIVIWAVLQLLVSLSFAVFATVGWAMVADCIDYQEMQTGKREEGTVYAIYSLGRKIAQGLGAAVVLLMLGWVGFKKAEIINIGGIEFEIAGTQTGQVPNNIRLLIGGVYLVCSLVQFVMIKWVYPLTKEKVAEMNAKLGRTNEVKVELNTED